MIKNLERLQKKEKKFERKILKIYTSNCAVIQFFCRILEKIKSFSAVHTQRISKKTISISCCNVFIERCFEDKLEIKIRLAGLGPPTKGKATGYQALIE